MCTDMKYKCELPETLAKSVLGFREFANGAAQATIKLKNGEIFEGALVSGSRAIVALRGYREPPFDGCDIAEIYQSEIDLESQDRSGWEFWDKW